MKPSVIFIGAGNVAGCLALALKSHCNIRQVYSRDITNAETLARLISPHCKASSSLENIEEGSDFYIVSVPDDAISEVLTQTSHIESGVWVHTSGSVGMDVFSGMKDNYGVFYPLQTFSKNKAVDFAEIPVFIEGNTPETQRKLLELASLITDKCQVLDSESRRRLHVAAVFACNFVNSLWIEARELTDAASLDFSLLMPLIRETVAKLDTMPPREAQTGPARRRDMLTIERHLNALPEQKAKIYQLLTENIFRQFS